MPPTTVVPNVLGLGCNEAFERVADAGLLPVVQFQQSSAVDWGLVIQTNPLAGNSADSKATIVLYVSTGAALPPLT